MTEPIEFECPLVNGLHARPATGLADVCAPFDAEIELLNLRNNSKASAHSVLALISADIRHKDKCEIRISGVDAAAAEAKIRFFVNRELAHCDDDAGLTGEPDTGSSPPPRSLQELTTNIITGQGVAAGVGIGAPLVLSGPEFPPELLDAVAADANTEWQGLSSALETLARQFESDLLSKTATEAAVLRAHLAILRDSEFGGRLQQALADAPVPITSARAISRTVEHFDQVLAATGNPYLQERALDIRDICVRLMRTIYGDEAVVPVPVLDQPTVVVAGDLTPGDFMAIRSDALRGLVLENGGRTSHTIILARAAGIPTLVGAAGAVLMAASHAGELVVDANNGVLVSAYEARVRAYYQRETEKFRRLNARFDAFRNRQAQTADGRRMVVAANIALADESAPAFAAGAEGIGLFRTEMLLMDRDDAPSEDEQFDAYRAAVEAGQGKPVIIRTFDIGGDKPISWLSLPAEENPFLGVRAVRLYPRLETLFRSQLKALLRAANYGDLRIMIPMISTLEELRWVRAAFEDELEQAQTLDANMAVPQFGIMLEVPSAALLLDKMAPYCDFISIGSNDLAQYFLACDRGNGQLSELYNGYHPAFLRFLNQVVQDAKQHELEVGICGELASDPKALPLLAGMGMDEISVSAPAVLRSKAGLAQLDSGACRVLLDQVLDADDAGAVQQLLDSYQGSSPDLPLFDQELIVFEREADSKAAVIKQLVDLAHLADRTGQAAALEEAVWQREDVFSTGLGFGIAIPHCKSAAVTHNSLCIARFETPLDWGSRDGQPVDTVIMLIIRESDAGDTHLKIFAQLARKIMHADFRAELRACSDAQRLLQFLQDILEPVSG
jgi:phosphoenolpyruvate-protein phosphotransferase